MKKIEKVAREMAAIVGAEHIAPPRPEVLRLIAAWHLRELAKARGRTLGYVELIPGLTRPRSVYYQHVLRRPLPSASCVARVVLVPRKKRRPARAR